MRITYRNLDVKQYWTNRWEDIPADSAMQNLNVYPLKYAAMTVNESSGRILEAGCGAGRLMRYYHDKGYQIKGIDFVEVAIQKLKEADPTLDVEVGDITKLKYENEYFKYVLAFGLYHNLEQGLDLAIGETHRVLTKGGCVCASFRADNIQTKITDWLSERKEKQKNPHSDNQTFHKMNLTLKEYKALFSKVGFSVEYTAAVENMPFLYKFTAFRSTAHKKFDENKARAEGYRLSWLGGKVQRFLMHFFPNQFCNVYVIIARKNDD